jgi:hypothetical protein
MTTVTILTGSFSDYKQTYVSGNADDWGDLSSSTWSAWNRWNDNNQGVSIRLDDDLASSTVRTATLQINLQGDPTYQLKISNTGAFAGEETTINFSAGTTYAIPAGRYYRWTITVAEGSTGLVPEIRNFFTVYGTNVGTDYQRAIDTSTLGGTISARTVTHNFGTVYSVDMTTYNSTIWTDRYYALPDSFSVSTISPVPGIVSTSPLTIVLRDHMGVAVDGFVDITIRGTQQVQITQAGIELV